MTDVFTQHFALDWFLSDRPDDTGARIDISVDTALQFVNVRGDTDDDAFAAAMSSAGCALPGSVNSCQGSAPIVYWLAPGEWLVATGDAAALAAELRAAFQDNSGSAVDLSDAYVALTVTGDEAADVLAAGCTIDLHPAEFRPGSCAQTRVSRIAVLIACRADTTGFDLIVRRSFAEYLALWLQDAAPNKKVKFNASPAS